MKKRRFLLGGVDDVEACIRSLNFGTNRERPSCIRPSGEKRRYRSSEERWIVNRKNRNQMVREGNGPRLCITEIE